MKELKAWYTYGRLNIPVYNFEGVKYHSINDLMPYSSSLYVVKLGSFNINEYRENKELPYPVGNKLDNSFNGNSLIAVEKDGKYYIFGGLHEGNAHRITRSAWHEVGLDSVSHAINRL